LIVYAQNQSWSTSNEVDHSVLIYVNVIPASDGDDAMDHQMIRYR